MRTKRVLLDYSGFKDDELNTLVGKVLDCLTDHAVFTDPPIELTELSTQMVDFREKWQVASRGGSLLEISEKNDAKGVLAASLRDIAFYVNKMSGGSRSKLLSSGLQLEADPKEAQVPNKVTGGMLVDGKQQNQMDIKFKPQKEALIYEYQIADGVDDDGAPIWKETFQTGSSRGNMYAPTVPDRTYYLRVRARNKKGIGDWSDVFSLKAR